MSKPKVGRAFVAGVWMECPYCGSSDVSGEDGSFAIVWNESGVLTCNDCEKECL